MITVHVNIDTAAIERKLQKAAEAAVFDAAEKALEDCNQYCPKDQNTLIDSSLIHSEPEKGIMRWKTPYSRSLYYGIVMVDPKTGKACFWIDGLPYSRKGIKKVKSDPPREYQFGDGRRKLWAQYAHSKHSSDWKDMFQASLRLNARKR